MLLPDTIVIDANLDAALEDNEQFREAKCSCERSFACEVCSHFLLMQMSLVLSKTTILLQRSALIVWAKEGLKDPGDNLHKAARSVYEDLLELLGEDLEERND